MKQSKEEAELSKFLSNPDYRTKVINRVHKDEDKAYDKRIKSLKSELSELELNRTSEINRISTSRWSPMGYGLSVNYTEGKIRINKSDYLFSSIKGAEINMITGARVVTTENSKSKKHTSLGGAIVGGAIAGVPGAVIGGVGLGKTDTKGKSVSNQIPTCLHLGIMVNLDGFVQEIILIGSQVDQLSPSFIKAQNNAQAIIAQLGELAKTKVPETFLKPYEESSVIAIDKEIKNKNQELELAIADKPTYALPDMYRTAEQKNMSDEEYLQYLANVDEQKMAERIARRKEEVAQEREQREADEKRKQEERERWQLIKERNRKEQEKARAEAKAARDEKIASGVYQEQAKFIGKIIFMIIGWVSDGTL